MKVHLSAKSRGTRQRSEGAVSQETQQPRAGSHQGDSRAGTPAMPTSPCRSKQCKVRRSKRGGGGKHAQVLQHSAQVKSDAPPTVQVAAHTCPGQMTDNRATEPVLNRRSAPGCSQAARQGEAATGCTTTCQPFASGRERADHVAAENDDCMECGEAQPRQSNA